MKAAVMQTDPNKPEAERAPAKPASASEAQNAAQLLEKTRADSATVLIEPGTKPAVTADIGKVPGVLELMPRIYRS
jgi:hypothetical protein